MTTRLKQKIGCWLNERWRTELVLQSALLAKALGMSWLDWCNRSERLLFDPVSGGRVCDWQDSSKLTVARVFPEIGLRMLAYALNKWPIDFNLNHQQSGIDTPEVSFLIAIGGLERLSQFELALAAARAQQGVDCEIVVVEQSTEALLAERLPLDVRYVHQSSEIEVRGFNKSWALNRAAREARGEVLIILDADYLVPTSFANECYQLLQSVEGIRPGRLIFYLDKLSTQKVLEKQNLSEVSGLDSIVANNPTPIAIRKSTYWEIGGHDESYFGWGGEDIEFLDRLRTKSMVEGGWLPLIHLWHPPAEKKTNGDRNRALHRRILACNPQKRITQLTTLNPDSNTSRTLIK